MNHIPPLDYIIGLGIIGTVTSLMEMNEVLRMLILGGKLPSASINTDVRTWISNNYATELPHPISTYVHRDMMVEGRGYFGKSNFTDTLFLGYDDKLYSSGTVYAAKGLRTADADNPTTIFNGPALFLGAIDVGGHGGATHKLRIRYNNFLYDIDMREV